jgi:hypothetical protein
MRKMGLIEDEELSDVHKALIAEKRALLENGAANADDAGTDSDFPAGAELCKKCHTTAMVLLDSCMTCLNCGDSKCG